MPRPMRHGLATSAMLLTTSAALADVTAEDVWTDWQSYITAFGYQLSGQESRAGNSLVISDLVLNSGQAAGDAKGEITMDRVVFSERADGSVLIELPTVMPFVMTTPNDAAGQTTIRMNYTQSGLDIVASGTPTDMLYLYSADRITLESTGFEINDRLLAAEDNNIEVVFTNMSGTTDMTLDSRRLYDQKLDVKSVSYDIAMADPNAEGRLTMKGQTQGLDFAGVSALPLRVVQATDMDAMLAAGFTVDGMFRYGPNALEFLVASPQGPMSGSFIAEGGSVGVSMGADGLAYDVTQDATSVEMTSAQLPFPLTFDVARSAFKLAMPVRKSDTAEDFALGFTLDGFAMSDLLWGLFDPSSQLPRDPATIAVDLAGKARLLFDVLNPDLAATAMTGADAAPAEIEALDINKLQITVAGAELTGQGGFTFDNSGGGAPRPNGAVDLKLVGGNGLLDKLVAIGLLPEQQAMGARMMMGLLAVPGGAPDTLNSKIEINEQGHVTANGQRIQ